MVLRRRPAVIRNRYFVLSDLLLTALAAALGFAIRLEVPAFWSRLPVCLRFVVLAMAIKPIVYYFFGLYRRYWRYASVPEMAVIFSAVTAASALLAVLILGLLLPHHWFSMFPRSALIIDWLLSLFFVGGIRFSVRYLNEVNSINGRGGPSGKPRRVLVVGAGDAGAMIVREMRNNPGVGVEPAGYVDDNPAKVGMRIHDLPVLGQRQDIPDLVREFAVDEVLIAMPTAPGQAIREIKELCERVPVPYKTVPAMYELLNGTVSVNQIREVQIEDLLRRDPVPIRCDDGLHLRGQRVLITGAGGSIGSELCRQVARRQPAQIILVGHGENSIYQIYQELSARFPRLQLTPAIADVRDRARISRIFQAHHPHVVFHAAAHKHVPLMEQNAEEAITNNVMGTRNLLEVAQEEEVKQFVLISSDKAVNPINVMGATKRIAELLVQDAALRTGYNYVAVRFGNVLGSRGSVVPLFKQQIAAGGPVTVTHPEMERYFMTIPEAVYLVLQAAAFGQSGEVYVLDMGEPIKIVDLARNLITLSGLQPDRDIAIEFTGVRCGEKLRERLFLDGEDYETTRHEKIFVFKARCAMLGGELQRAVEKLITLAQRGAPEADLWAAVKAIVPECGVALPTSPPGPCEARPSPEQRRRPAVAS